MSSRKIFPLLLTTSVAAGLVLGVSVGVRNASAADTNPCGSDRPGVCSYVSNGCAEGLACTKWACPTVMVCNAAGSPEDVCWRCTSM